MMMDRDANGEYLAARLAARCMKLKFRLAGEPDDDEQSGAAAGSAAAEAIEPPDAAHAAAQPVTGLPPTSVPEPRRPEKTDLDANGEFLLADLATKCMGAATTVVLAQSGEVSDITEMAFEMALNLREKCRLDGDPAVDAEEGGEQGGDVDPEAVDEVDGDAGGYPEGQRR